MLAARFTRNSFAGPTVRESSRYNPLRKVAIPRFVFLSPQKVVVVILWPRGFGLLLITFASFGLRALVATANDHCRSPTLLEQFKDLLRSTSESVKLYCTLGTPRGKCSDGTLPGEVPGC